MKTTTHTVAGHDLKKKPPEDRGFIYRVTSPSGKQYIGQTTGDIAFRLNNHRNGHNQGLLKASIKKYGLEKMTVEIIQVVPTGDLSNVERSLIKKYNTIAPNGYNLTEGGEGGARSEITRAKMSATHKGMKSSKEARRKIGEANRRRIWTDEAREKCRKKSASRSYIRSDEYKAKLSASLMGHGCSPETRAKIGAKHRGRKASPETRAKMSKSHRALNRRLSEEQKRALVLFHLGRKRSLETRMNISKAMKLSWGKRKQVQELADERRYDESY